MIIGIEAAHAAKDNRTGVEEYCFQIIQELKKQLPSSVRVVLYSHRLLKGELGMVPQNWEIKYLWWPFKKLFNQLRLSWEFLWHRPDVFFAPGQLVPFFCPKNTVAMIHDSAFLAVPGSYTFLGKIYLKWMNRRIIKVSKIILTSSEFNKKELIKYYGISPEKIKVIPLAYDKARYYCHSDPEYSGEESLAVGQLSQRFLTAVRNDRPTKPFIMSVGRLEAKKNTVNIIKAFNLIREKIDCQLLLVGKPGHGYSEVAAEIGRSPYKKDIICSSYVEAGEIAVLLNLAQVFVFPSLYEGFGLPLLESMARGCPVVASGGGALEEVGGQAAIYVNPEKVEDIAGAISRLLNDKTLREEKIKAGLERVKNYSWEKTGRQTAEVLEALLSLWIFPASLYKPIILL